MFFRRKRDRAQQAKQATDGGPSVTFSVMPTETAARQAAAGGSPEEMNRLGINLKMQDKPDEAAEWFRRAGEAGNSDAAANLAMYLMSKGRNAEAAQWFRRAGGPLGAAMAAQLAEKPDGSRG